MRERFGVREAEKARSPSPASSGPQTGHLTSKAHAPPSLHGLKDCRGHRPRSPSPGLAIGSMQETLAKSIAAPADARKILTGTVSSPPTSRLHLGMLSPDISPGVLAVGCQFVCVPFILPKSR